MRSDAHVVYLQFCKCTICLFMLLVKTSIASFQSDTLCYIAHCTEFSARCVLTVHAHAQTHLHAIIYCVFDFAIAAQ
jgi:hypothetical protein